MNKKERAAADAAYLRSLQPDLPMEAAPAAPRAVEHFDVVPTDCPACQKHMTIASGWTLVFGDLLQCGGCGVMIDVPRPQYVAYAERLHAHYAAASWVKPTKAKRGPKERGAG